MAKIITAKAAAGMVKDGMTIMVGGFLANGSPCSILEALAELPVKDLTIITNDTSYPDRGVGILVARKKVSKLIVSHIGTNPETGAQYNSGEVEVEFCPQGTLAERIRAGGCGLGGVLTRTGLGTLVAEGKETVQVDGIEYLLEKPLRADIALVGASVADQTGNLVYHGTSQNFNPLMAMAADLVIAEAGEMKPVGGIEPYGVHTPAVLVDYLIELKK